MITHSQVKKILGLLHKDYQDCNIALIKGKLDYLRYIIREARESDIKHHLNVLSGKTLGTYNSKRNDVQIYLMNIEGQSANDLMCFTIVLFHEARHHYQNKYNKLHNANIEKDCDSFALKMFQRHWNEIQDEILN